MFNRLKAGLEVSAIVLVIVTAGSLLWRIYWPKFFSANADTRYTIEDITGWSIDSAKIRRMRGNGPLVLVEFSDYQCPFCIKHFQVNGPVINKELIDSGKIRHAFFYYPVASHQHAQQAAEAAECAAQQERFWEMHDWIFRNPTLLELGKLSEQAHDMGLDRSSFMECMEKGQAKEHVSADFAEGNRLGITGTPAFFVGTLQSDNSIKLLKRFSGFGSVERIVDAIDELNKTS